MSEQDVEYLITGQTGKLNVSAEAAAAFHAGIVGDGQYVMTGFECTLNGTTAVNIAGGVICMNGREIYLNQAGTSVDIDAGASGTNRRDLIVVRFQRSNVEDTQVEHVEFAYLKGTAASSPSDPTYNVGNILDGTALVDMPLARITWTGTVPQIEVIAERFQSAADYRDSIFPVSVKLEAKTDASSIECKAFVIKALRLIILQCVIITNKQFAVNGRYTVASFPAEYVPANNADLFGSSDGNGIPTVQARTDGDIVVIPRINSVQSNKGVSFSGFWFF